MGLVVLRRMGGEPQDQQPGTWDLQPEACFLLGDCSSHPSYQRGGSAHLGQVGLQTAVLICIFICIHFPRAP